MKKPPEGGGKEEKTAMGTIEEIQRYIGRTVKPGDLAKYQMTLEEAFALNGMPDEVMAIFLAFKYGLAKGCRAARAKARKRKEKVT